MIAKNKIISIIILYGIIPRTGTGLLIGLRFLSSNDANTETTAIGTSSMLISYWISPCSFKTLTKYEGV